MNENAGTCRACSGALFASSLLEIAAAPPGAQLFTEERSDSQAATIPLKVAQCGSCGLVQLRDAQPVPYYRSNITSAGVSPEMRAFRVRQFEELVSHFSLRDKRVVDIGASRGHFVDLLAQVGTTAVGLEYGLADERGRTENGNVLLRGHPTADGGLVGGPYDGFICINFLEHAPEPVRFLRDVAAGLVPGAAGIVEVPSFENMLEQKVSYDWVVDHLSYFDAHSLRAVLEIAGFEVRRIDRVWHGYDIAATVVRRAPIDLGLLQADFTKAVERFSALVSERNSERLAVWGASHQALTVLTTSGQAATNIRCIIDSAPFKQGKFAPGCGLPVRDPSAVSIERIDCVIIMAAGYANEIGRDLRARLGFNGEIIVYKGSAPPEKI